MTRHAKAIVTNDDPYLSLEDVEVRLGYSEDGKTLYVQIDTSQFTDSWQRIKVFMNDGEAVRWK